MVTTMMSLYVGIVAIALGYLLRKPFLKLITPKGIKDVPTFSDPRPIWGDVHRVASTMKEHGGITPLLDQVAKELGPIAQLRIGFFQNLLVLSDLPTIEHVLLKQTKNIDRANITINVFKWMTPTGQIALPTNDMWKHHRRIVGPAMTSKYLSLSTPLATRCTDKFVKYIATKAHFTQGRPFEIEEDFRAVTMDVICSIAFGQEWGIVENYENQVKAMGKVQVGPVGQAVFKFDPLDLQESAMYLFDNVNNFSAFPGIDHFFKSIKPDYRKHSKRMALYLKDKLAEARARAKEMGPEVAAEMANNTLDMMVARELKGEDWMSDDEMRDELYLCESIRRVVLIPDLIAGTETSSTTLSWWAKYVSNNPSVQYKLRAHLLEKVPELSDRVPTFEDLSSINTPYLEAVVHETLRLSRTAGAYNRQVFEDTVILGKLIPKGTDIIFPTVTGYEDESSPIYTVPETFVPMSTAEKTHASGSAAAQLDNVRPEGASRKVGYWKAGTGRQFDPERWLDSEGRFDINSGPSLPFSLGQRGCFGKNLALLELRLIICALSLSFFFAPVEDDQNLQLRKEKITSHPVQAIVRPVPWDQVKA